MQLVALGRLLRVSLLASAVADVAAGLVVGARGRWPEEPALLWLFPASLGIYHGGLALNDWADRREDAATRPDRPIPSGKVSAGAALATASVLLAAGVACAFAAHARLGLGALVLAALVLLYDLRGRGPLAGPALLAACRALNLALPIAGAGLFFASEPLRPVAAVAPPLLYAGYVFSLSRLARLEDGSSEVLDPALPRRVLHACALYLVAAPFAVGAGDAAGNAPPWHALALGAALALAGALGLWKESRAPGAWTRARAGAATGAALRRLLIFTASITLASWREGATAPLVAAAILCGYPVSRALRRAFPPT